MVSIIATILALGAQATVAPDELLTLAPGWTATVVATVDQSYVGWDVEIGDADNDAQMIEYAGHGYAMESGDADVVANAKFVAPSNDSDGVARVLESLLAQNEIGG